MKGEMTVGSGGAFSSKIFGNDGIATERETVGTDIDALVGDPLVSENHRFKELAVDGAPCQLANRADHCTKFWIRAKIAYDELPLSDSAPIAGTTIGQWWQVQIHARRQRLARLGISYLVRGYGDPYPDESALALAREYVKAHEHDPSDEIPVSPLVSRGLLHDERLRSWDPSTGIGVGQQVRIVDPGLSADDELARQARISAPPMHDADKE